jgi:hypothetical protein
MTELGIAAIILLIAAPVAVGAVFLRLLLRSGRSRPER